jgi:hypothetical protein
VSKDISGILEGWDYDPDSFSVRIVAGSDGREKLQLRLDLGLLQMELDGRPDGARPGGSDSWLEYYERKQQAHLRAAPHLDRPFVLNEQALGRLLREGVQYYHRYLSFWHLGRYELCARDTARNLRLFAFVRQHAADDRAKLQFDQYRPYVTMMHTRAVATPLVELRDYDTALGVIDAGIKGVRQFLADYAQQHRADQCAELVQLEQWREQVEGQRNSSERRRPPTQLESLRRRLDEAVADERFEEAARLRDEIRRLDAAQPTQPGDG